MAHLPGRNSLSFPASIAPIVDQKHFAFGDATAVSGQTNFPVVTAIATRGGFYNQITGKLYTMSGTVGTFTDRVAGYAVGNANSANSPEGDLSANWPDFYPTTLAAIFVCSGTQATAVGYIITAFSTGTLYNAIAVNTSNTVQFFAGGVSASSGVTLNIGSTYFIAVSFLSTSSLNFIIYEMNRGRVQTGNINPSGGATTTPSAIHLLALNANGNPINSGYIAAAMASQAQLGIGQLRVWADDPWQFWYARQFFPDHQLPYAKPPPVNTTYTLLPSSYTVTGNPTIRGVGVNSVPGSYAVTGNPSLRGVGLTPSPGSYAVAGNPAVRGIGLTPVAGAYTVTGNPAVRGIGLTPQPGSYAVTGIQINIKLGRAFYAQPSSYTVTGNPSVRGIGLTSAPGSYAVTGNPIQITTVQFVQALVYLFTVSGRNVACNYGVSGVGTLFGFSNPVYPIAPVVFATDTSGGTPGNSYVAENGTTLYVAEDGTTYYVQES